MRADTNDVAFRLFLALGELWDGLRRAQLDPSVRGLHLSSEHLGGYVRYSAGHGSHSRLVVEWNESSRHLRIIRCEEWPGFDALISSTIAHIRQEARKCGLLESVDASFMRACNEQVPVRRTVLAGARTPATRGTVAVRHA